MGQRVMRMVRFRLVIPVVRSRQPPENTARAVAVGVFWALTPTFGIQMALSGLHWYIARTFFNRDFNVVLAMAWTWVTNLFTLVPTYYLFFLTGQILLGHWDDLSGYASFQQFILKMADNSDPFSLKAWEGYFAFIIKGWGLAILVGSIPIAFAGYFVGYHWTLHLVRQWRRRKLERRAARRVARQQKASKRGGSKR